MGMTIGIDARDRDVDLAVLDDAIERAFAWLHWVDATFSTYKDGSEISRLGRGEIGLDDCPAEVRAVLERCEELRLETGGFFDARANGARDLDPSGLVKGWSVEQASALLSEAGSVNHCINAAGDVRTRGAPDPGRLWHVGIAHPHQHDALTAVVAVGDGAVATSGIAERGLHVYDPHTGRPVLELASVTMIGDSLADTDAYATAALAMGVDAPGWLAGLSGYEALVIDSGGFQWTTDGFDRYRLPIPDESGELKGTGPRPGDVE
jgi:thiamine biosynthesis lipoprotein